MQHPNRSRALILVLAAAGLSACGSPAFDSGAASDAAASRVVPIKATNLNEVILSAHAARRLGIETARVTGGRRGETRMPYAALLYGPAGDTFVYTSPAPLTYVRRPVAVAAIAGSVAVLRAGPPSGTAVVTVGAAELLGTEYGVED